jgi:hypothetical protein
MSKQGAIYTFAGAPILTPKQEEADESGKIRKKRKGKPIEFNRVKQINYIQRLGIFIKTFYLYLFFVLFVV